MKQRGIQAFFGAAPKKEGDGPKSTQKKISSFFAGGANGNATPAGVKSGEHGVSRGMSGEQVFRVRGGPTLTGKPVPAL